VATAPSGLIGQASVSEQEGITHSYHEHDLSLKKHKHVAIDLLESLFNTSDDHDSENETLLYSDQLDKHITTHAYTSPQILMTFFRGEYNKLIKKVTAGYLNMSKQPPQFS
jgi:galactose-1-phosphate uridylyltransferase